MPIRELLCNGCGSQVEVRVSITEPDPPCPQCKVPRRRLVSSTSFSLKGEGWARDNYGVKPKGGGR